MAAAWPASCALPAAQRLQRWPPSGCEADKIPCSVLPGGALPQPSVLVHQRGGRAAVAHLAEESPCTAESRAAGASWLAAALAPRGRRQPVLWCGCHQPAAGHGRGLPATLPEICAAADARRNATRSSPAPGRSRSTSTGSERGGPARLVQRTRLLGRLDVPGCVQEPWNRGAERQPLYQTTATRELNGYPPNIVVHPVNGVSPPPPLPPPHPN
ncbi:unnamed protein product [Gadus morhua 'NCC']